MILHSVKKKITAVIFILAVLFFTVIAITAGNKENTEASCAVAAGVKTKSKVFSLCAEADKNTEEQDIKMFISVCSGFDIKPTIFFEKEYFQSKKDSMKENSKKFECGMIIPDEFEYYNFSKVSSMMKKENSKFFDISGIFPKYCTFSDNKNPDRNISAALAENGQTFILKSNVLKNMKSGTIMPGSIVYVGKITDKTAYETAEFLCEAEKAEMNCLSVSMLLNTFGE